MNTAINNRMPILFVGHGNPMNALEDSSFALEWIRLGNELPRPKAIIVLSAHWTTRGRMVTAMPRPKTIYDFSGFPKELYEVKYDAPGDTVLAERISQLLPGTSLDFDWGLDHGAWSVLVRMFPGANIPVVQISLDVTKNLKEEYELMKKLRPLRDEGVLIIGSGNIVHNLMMMNWDGEPQSFAIDFDEKVKMLLEKNDTEALLLPEYLGEDARLSIPTDEHYRPMIGILALRDPDEEWVFFNEAIDLGSIGMRSFVSR